MTIAASIPDTLKMKRVLVTGASGFIGSRLVERLVAADVQTVALSRTRSRLARLLAKGNCAHLPCDITDAAAVRDAIAAVSPDVVFHFASAPDGAETADLASARLRVNTTGTLHLLESCIALETRPVFIYGDSRKVYGATTPPHLERSALAPTSTYAASKAAGWLLCHAMSSIHGLPVVSLRPSLIYGLGQGRNIVQVAIDAASSGAPAIRLQGGSQTRDPLFIEDAIDAFLAAAVGAAALDRCVINIGGGEEVCVRDLVERIAAIVGSDLHVECEPAKTRPNEIWRSACDNAEAAAMLGWQPMHSLRAGLKRTVRETRAANTGAMRVGAAS